MGLFDRALMEVLVAQSSSAGAREAAAAWIAAYDTALACSADREQAARRAHAAWQAAVRRASCTLARAA